MGQSNVCEDKAKESGYRNGEDMRNESVMLEWVVISHKLIVEVADLSTLPG
jgi:hypothetical protein